VWVGRSLLDRRALLTAAERLPSWRFHVIGDAGPLPQPNVVAYGELPYAATVPYVRHADVGLAMYDTSDAAATRFFASSLKIVQYAYCGLPIVVPDTVPCPFPRTFAYDPADAESIVGALLAARAPAAPPERPALGSWSELALALAG
jgi:2-beta-glucuronyltransferase